MHFAVDTNFLIYFFDSNGPLHGSAVKIYRLVEAGRLKISGSELLFAELLAYPALDEHTALQINNKLKLLQIVYQPINLEILGQAARFRREHTSIRLPDAIHIATALYNRADRFITNDLGILNLKEIDGMMIEGLK